MALEYKENSIVRRHMEDFRHDLLDFIAKNSDLAPETLTRDLAHLKKNPDLATQRWVIETLLKLMNAYPNAKVDVGVSGEVRMEHAPDYSGLGLTKEQLAAIAGIALETVEESSGPSDSAE